MIRKIRKLASIIFSVCILLSTYTVGVTAAETGNILMSWNGENTITNLNGLDLSNVANVVDFNGQKVVQLLAKSNGVPVGGRAINYWSLTTNRNLNKRLSFQIYVPAENYYYIDLRLASARHTEQGITNANLNNISQFTFATDAEKNRFIIGVYDGKGSLVTTKGISQLDAWHNVDIYVNDKTVSYFVDYEYVGDTDVIGEQTYSDGFDHAFKGFQMCIGQNGVTTGAEDGMYIRNLKLSSFAPKVGSTILDDNFENYPIDTEVLDGGDITDINSALHPLLDSTKPRYNSFVTIDANYANTGILGFKKLSDGKTVFVARNTPDNPRAGNNRDLRYGFWMGQPVDLKRGPVTIEFDINIPDPSKLSNLIIQPFAHNTANGALEAEINIGGIDATINNVAQVNTRTAYASLVTPGASPGSLFNIRKDGQIYLGTGLDGNPGFYHSDAYTPGQWANLKFVITKVGEESYKTRIYLNDIYFGEQSTEATVEKARQTAATDNVRGVRFISVAGNASASVEDLYYIDNLKMYLNEGANTNYDVLSFRLTDNFGNIIGDNIAAGTKSVDAGVIISKNKEMSDDACIILAQYRDDGALIESNLKELALKDAEDGSMVGAMVSANLSQETTKVKAFLWASGTLKPIQAKFCEKSENAGGE